jgi:hypothetical protein
MMVIVDSSRPGLAAASHARSSSAPRRLATAAVVAAAMIAGVLAWRWALVEATTDYGPSPDSLSAEPALRPYTTHAPPPMELEVTVLDVHTAAAVPAVRAPRAPAKSGAAEARVPAPSASAKTRR